MRFRFKSYGDAEALSKELEGLIKLTDNGTLDEALTAGGDIVVEGIRGRIRSDARRSSGALAKSIKYRLDQAWLSGRTYAVVFGWSKDAVRKSKAGKTTYTTDYGPVLEFDSKRQLRHLESGFDEAKGAAEDAMARVITSAIEKSA